MSSVPTHTSWHSEPLYPLQLMWKQESQSMAAGSEAPLASASTRGKEIYQISNWPEVWAGRGTTCGLNRPSY